VIRERLSVRLAVECGFVMQPQTNHNIRAVEEVDLSACVALFVDVFNAPPWNETWNRDGALERLNDCFRTPGFAGWVLEGHGQLRAFALGYRGRYDRERHFFLKEMCVHPACQRQGLGQELMAQLCSDLAASGVRRVYLVTARGGPAEAFYQCCGFAVSPRIEVMSRRFMP
jgi:aminoglycoside 6'-N-acetyltransferase I